MDMTLGVPVSTVPPTNDPIHYGKGLTAIESHRPGETAQSTPLCSTWEGWMLGVGREEAEREEERVFRKRSGLRTGSGASVLFLTMEHAHLIPINSCHHLQSQISFQAHDKALAAGE